MIPYLDLTSQDSVAREAIDRAIERVRSNASYILGQEGKQFEAELAAYCGTKYAIGCNSGTDALYLVMRALDINEGCEVITTPFTFIATAEMIAETGARPVFADIDDATLNLDITKLNWESHGQAAALIPVHLYGLPADMSRLQEWRDEMDQPVPVIEDAAQAIGATYHGQRVGSLGTAACFSFFPAKNLGAYGDAGMVVTDDENLAMTIRLLRNHGSRVKYQHEVLGVSSRLDELQAAILRAKLPYLDGWNAARQQVAAQYSEFLRPAPCVLAVPNIPAGRTCVFQQYTIRVDRRDALIDHLKQRGVPTAVHYPRPLHLQPAFAYLGHGVGDFPVAELASQQVLSLPCYPAMPEEHVAQVIAAIRSF